MSPITDRDGGAAGWSDARRFGAAVDAPHRHLSRAEWDDVYVVGDVHGCVEELRALLARLDPAADDLVLFVGDLIRKGPDSAAVVDLVRSRPNLVAVRGNNEQKVIDGDATLPGLEDPGSLADLPVVVSVGDAVVLHGGIDPRRPAAAHDREALLETRAVPPGESYDGPFWFQSHEGPPRAFFGHTVLAAPLVREWAVGLDTGCVYGGSLTAYDLARDATVSVPARETYRERPDRKVVDVHVTDD